MIDREQYYRELEERQRKHLESLRKHFGDQGAEPHQPAWRPCLHEACQRCHGTGHSIHGMCVHALSCPCPKCSTYSMVSMPIGISAGGGTAIGDMPGASSISMSSGVQADV